MHFDDWQKEEIASAITWGIGFMLFTAVFWLVWYLIAKSVPTIVPGISRWLDIPSMLVIGAGFGYLYKAHENNCDDKYLVGLILMTVLFIVSVIFSLVFLASLVVIYATVYFLIKGLIGASGWLSDKLP
jgi:hypothetical protein